MHWSHRGFTFAKKVIFNRTEHRRETLRTRDFRQKLSSRIRMTFPFQPSYQPFGVAAGIVLALFEALEQHVSGGDPTEGPDERHAHDKAQSERAPIDAI